MLAFLTLTGISVGTQIARLIAAATSILNTRSYLQSVFLLPTLFSLLCTYSFNLRNQSLNTYTFICTITLSILNVYSHGTSVAKQSVTQKTVGLKNIYIYRLQNCCVRKTNLINSSFIYFKSKEVDNLISLKAYILFKLGLN